MATSERRRGQILAARRNRIEVKRPVKDPDGREYLKSFYGATKEEAEQKWRDYVNPVPAPDIASLTQIEELANVLPVDTVPWWFCAKLWPLKKHLRPNSVDALQQAARHLLPELQDVKIQAMTATVVAAALDRIAAKKTLRNRSAKPKRVRQPDGSFATIDPKPIYKPLSVAQLNKCRSLALEINELAADELERASGAKRVARINDKWVPVRKPPKKKAAEIAEDEIIYTPPMLWALINACKGTIAFAPAILCSCGLRINEALGAESGNLKKTRLLLVENQDDGEGELADLKSDNSVRYIPLPEELYGLLEPLTHRGERLALGIKKQVLMENNVRRSLYAVMKKCGLPPVNPHRLRKSFSSFFENNDCPKSVRRRLMGHSTGDLDGIYNKASERLARTWMERFFLAMLEPLGFDLNAPKQKALRGTKTPSERNRNGRAALTAEDVACIRERLKTETPYQIEKDYPVARRTIARIRDGEIWRNVS